MELTNTEMVLFETTKATQKERMEHQRAMRMSDGEKKRKHQLKRSFCANKELALQEVLEKAGLWDRYREWSGLYGG